MLLSGARWDRILTVSKKQPTEVVPAEAKALSEVSVGPAPDPRTFPPPWNYLIPLFTRFTIWIVFFVWGLVYLLRWIPESWREWFSR